jgi:hypothetical protein
VRKRPSLFYKLQAAVSNIAWPCLELEMTLHEVSDNLVLPSFMHQKLRLIFYVSLFVLAAAGCSTASHHEDRKKSVYLFTSFRDADQKLLRFLYSFDGYHWTNVPGTFLEANVGASKQFRDPSISAVRTGFFILCGRLAGTATKALAMQVQKI